MPKPVAPDARTQSDRKRDALKQQLRARLAALIPPGAVDAAALGTGLERSTIYKWLSGQQPRAVELAILANYLGVSVSDLLGDHPLQRTPTAYDANREYRSLVDALELVSAEDRGEIVRHAVWASRIAAAAQNTEDRRVPAPAPSAEVSRGSLYAPPSSRTRNASTKRARKSNVRS